MALLRACPFLLVAVLALAGCRSSKIPDAAEPYVPMAVEGVGGLTEYLVAAGVRIRYQDRDSTDYYRNPLLRRLPQGAPPDSLTRVVRVDLLDFVGPGSCLVYTYDPAANGVAQNRPPARYLYRTLPQGPDFGGISAMFYFGRLEAVCRALSTTEVNALRGLEAYAAPSKDRRARVRLKT